VRRGEHCPVLRRQAPWPTRADRIRTLAQQHGHELPKQRELRPVNGVVQDGFDAAITPDTAGSSHL